MTTTAQALAIVDAMIDRIEADSRRRFETLALADGVDVDQLDALLDANAVDWQAARDRAHQIIHRALDAHQES